MEDGRGNIELGSVRGCAHKRSNLCLYFLMKKEVGQFADELFPQVRKSRVEDEGTRSQPNHGNGGCKDGGWMMEDGGWSMEGGK